MKKQFIVEAARMQKLAGIRENISIVSDTPDFITPETLTIDFDYPVGLGSSYGDAEEIEEEDKEGTELETMSNDELQKFIDLTEEINDILYDELGAYGDIEIDWRGNSEVEIHNVPSSINIDKLVKALNSISLA
jgi:hypothetical protein